MTDIKSRGWCFTLNNYTVKDIAIISSIYETQNEGCEYLIMGFEEGRNETPHIQGYIYFKNEKSFRTMQKLHPKWHVEKQLAKQNVHAFSYCAKDRDFYEFGKRPSQGNRGDLEMIKHDLLNGRPIKDISLEYFSQCVQYRRSFEWFKDLHSTRQTQVIAYDYSSDEDTIAICEYPGKNYYAGLENKIEIISKIKSNEYDNVFVPIGCLPDKLINKII